MSNSNLSKHFTGLTDDIYQKIILIGLILIQLTKYCCGGVDSLKTGGKTNSDSLFKGHLKHAKTGLQRVLWRLFALSRCPSMKRFKFEFLQVIEGILYTLTKT